MFSIKFSENAYSKLDSFIDSFKSNFIKIYTDTWIFDEKLICDSYIELWDRFNDLIVDKINEIFIENTILWISETEAKLLFITILVNNFRLFIYYTEDKKSKIRFIENIEFYRR